MNLKYISCLLEKIVSYKSRGSCHSNIQTYPKLDPVPSLVTWVLLVVGGPGTGGEQARPERNSLDSDVSSEGPDVLFVLIVH